MSLKNLFTARKAVVAFLLLGGALSSCVYVDEGLGSNFIPSKSQFAIGRASFRLQNLEMGLSDSLSGYSSSRITVGAIKSGSKEETRSSAFTLVPINENVDFGSDWENIRFHFTAVRDTFSVADESQMNIIQEIYAYEVTSPLDENYMYTCSAPEYDGTKLISKGPAYYNGDDSLSFDFTEEFARKYLEGITQEELDDLDKYSEKFPGIYLVSETPEGDGGRINMFEVSIRIEDSYYVTGNFAELSFRAKYEGRDEKVDTSFLFYFGPQERTTNTTQYALNICGHSSRKDFQEGQNLIAVNEGEDITVEGGGGIKPVVRSSEILKLLLDEFERQGVDPKSVVINKASIIFPFAADDYRELELYPQYLSPTSRISGKTTSESDGEETRYVTYAGLTDASISTENQGDINRSLYCYSPDVSHHVQEIVKKLQDKDPSDEENRELFESYDIWMLIMANETVTSSSSSNSDWSSYLQDLAYANYYNSMYDPYGYGGYYGGYGGYGYGYGGYGYGYGYSNYYSYLLAQQYANSSQSETSEVTQLDKDRFYRCTLSGPDANLDMDLVPHMDIIYSYVPQQEQE